MGIFTVTEPDQGRLIDVSAAESMLRYSALECLALTTASSGIRSSWYASRCAGWRSEGSLN